MYDIQGAWNGIRGACIILVSREGKVLLHLRSSDPRVMYSGRWAFVSGGVEPGENPRAAIIREVMEETALEVVGRSDGPWRGSQRRPRAVRDGSDGPS